MIIEERLSSIKYVGRTEYRFIVTSEEDLEIGQEIHKSQPIEGLKALSLCEFVSECLGIDHDDQAHYSEDMKDSALGILDDNCDYDLECFINGYGRNQ